MANVNDKGSDTYVTELPVYMDSDIRLLKLLAHIIMEHPSLFGVPSLNTWVPE